MNSTPANLDRLTELLCDRAAGGRGPGESAELDRLLAEHVEVDADALDRSAAALAAGLLGGTGEAMPAQLARAIEADGVARAASRGLRLVHPGDSAQAGGMQPRPVAAGWTGWLAAAAALLVAAIGWWPRLFPAPAQQPAVLSAASQREQLLREDPKVIRASWVMPAPDSPDEACKDGCAGDVVWSNARQQGYMRFTGLARNDPRKNQYQLWIFDKNQPEATPVDGGVFDVTASGEVIVPIDAKLQIVDPTMFAVTVEKPGGVVRSERQRIPVLAKVDA